MPDPTSGTTSQKSSWMQLAIIVWAALAVALCVKVVIEGDRHSVYPAFAGGSRDWWAGEVMYDHLGYFYSPTFSVLFTPFAILPDCLGQICWGLSSIGLFFWSLRVFFRDVLPRDWPQETEAGFLLLTLGGALRSLWSLQSNALIMACVLFSAAAIVRNRWWRAAWLLALPIYIKVWPAIIAGLLSAHWPKKLIGKGLAACALLACVPFLTKAPTEVAGYYRAWIDCLANRESTDMRFTGYRDGWTIWEQIASPVNPRAYLLLQAIGGLSVLAWCLWIARQNRFERGPCLVGLTETVAELPIHGKLNRDEQTKPEIITYTVAAWTVWQLLLGPGTERLTYLLVAPFAAWAIITSHYQRRNFALAVTAFVTTFVLGAGGVERILIRWIPAATALQPIGIILFAIWLVKHAHGPSAWHNAVRPSEQLMENTWATSREAA